MLINNVLSHVSFVYVAKYHKSQICLKGFYNLYNICFDPEWNPHSQKNPKTFN